MELAEVEALNPAFGRSRYEPRYDAHRCCYCDGVVRASMLQEAFERAAEHEPRYVPTPLEPEDCDGRELAFRQHIHFACERRLTAEKAAAIDARNYDRLVEAADWPSLGDVMAASPITNALVMPTARESEAVREQEARVSSLALESDLQREQIVWLRNHAALALRRAEEREALATPTAESGAARLREVVQRERNDAVAMTTRADALQQTLEEKEARLEEARAVAFRLREACQTVTHNRVCAHCNLIVEADRGFPYGPRRALSLHYVCWQQLELRRK